MRCPPNQHLTTAARCPDAPTGVRGDYAPRSRRMINLRLKSQVFCLDQESGILVNKNEMGYCKDAVSNFIGRVSLSRDCILPI